MKNDGAVILELLNITKNFGGLSAVNDLCFETRAGEIKAIIGPNGSGKTTLLNVINGIYLPTSGEVRFKGKPITGLKSHIVASLGISRTFQILRLFQDLTVLDNVVVGCHRWSLAKIWDAALRMPRRKREERSMHDYSLECLSFFGIDSRAYDIVATLPFGEQRLVELARALASKAQLLLLDEPSSGLNDAEREKLCQLIQAVRQRGVAILLVEHNMDVVMSTADEIVVLNFGTKIAEGTPEQIRSDEQTIAAYLGA